MAVRNPGDDDRPTVDLGPRPEMVDGGESARAPSVDPGDLGPDDDELAAEATHAEPTDAETTHAGFVRGGAEATQPGRTRADSVSRRPDAESPRVDAATQRADPVSPRADAVTSPADAVTSRADAVTPADAITPDGVTPRPKSNSVHALPTQQLARKKSTTDSHHTKYSTATSPAEAMRLEELARTQVFLKVAIVTCVAGVGIALIAGGDPIGFRAVMAGCIVTLIGSLWMMWATRDAHVFSQRGIAGPALVIAIGAFGGVYYWGVASPVAAMITYGIYFFSLGANSRITFAMYVLVSVVHGGLIALIAAGVIADRGIVDMNGMRLVDQIGVLTVVEFLYFITYYTARTSQRVTLEHVSKLEQAVRGVAQREALLAEARAELDRALKIGGPGRFTDQSVGSFKLGVLIGRGGMGEVYEAKDAGGTEAAVKLLHPGTLSEPTHVARFVREAQTAAKLDCPHVVRVLEVGTTNGEVPYLAMERLRGHDLAHTLRRQRRLPLAQATVLANHIALGLEAARNAGIVHRDLKPHNVFLSTAGYWKILDFGVSKSGGSGTLTKGHVIGTPAYMAPEQARGEDVDHRADVYSLAAILYRSVTGHPAFTGKDVPTTLYDVVYRVPTQPSLLASVPSDVDRVLAVGLAKDLRDRFASAVELAAWFALATRDELSNDQRRRADDLMARHPWGTRQSGAP